MPVLLGALLGLVAVVVLAVTRKGETVTQPQTKQAAPTPQAANILDEIFARVGAARGVDPDLLKAIAIQESRLDPNAVRWHPEMGDVSAGLMQILARPPSKDWPKGQNFTPTNRFDIEGWPVTFEELFNPETNVDFGAQILHYNLSTFGFPRGVAAYNQWASRLAPLNGPFDNQAYVDNVLSNLRKLKGAS